MHIPRTVLPVVLALGLAAPASAPAVADTSGTTTGPFIERNISQTPDLATSKAKIDGLGFYVPARNAAGEPVAVEYRDAKGALVETRDEARPLVSVYTDDDADPAKGDDVWAAFSLDDGDTWRRTNLSMAAGRSSYTINAENADLEEVDYPGMVSKPALTLKGSRILVSWTSTFCDSGFPGYADLADDPYEVSMPQRSVDYADQGYPEVGEVPYKCLWATRGLVDTTSGEIAWYQPERLTSGARYAMQVTSNSAPGAGFVIGWAEDPAGLNPGEAQGPGEGWTGANPHPGTDVWYTYLPMTAFNAVAGSPIAHPDDPQAISQRPQPLHRFTVPTPVSDNALPPDADPRSGVGATRPAVGISPSSVTTGATTVSGAWVAYGYEETKEGEAGDGDVESGKQVFHHAFRYDLPDVVTQGTLVSDPRQSARRVRYITQPVGQMGESRTLGTLIYRMGPDGYSGSADLLMSRFVVPGTDAVTADNPFRAENLTVAVNLSATTPTESVPDPTTGVPRVTKWDQTEANLDDETYDSSLESARGHRGMIKGDFLDVGYLWTPNWKLYLQGLDIENYYVRRSFDGGATFTSAPAAAQYGGNGVTSCRWFNEPVTGALRKPLCRGIGAGEFEPAQNLTRLDGFDETAIEPRLVGMPGTIQSSYPEDVQDVSTVWQVWGTGSPQDAAAGDDGADFEAMDADIPIPGEDPGKGPLDLYYTVSQDYGDTFVENATIAEGPSAQAEVQVRFSPDGSKMYAAWNDLGTTQGEPQLDVFFRRITPDIFPGNTTPGELKLASETYTVTEGDDVVIDVQRVDGSNGVVEVAYATKDGTAVAGTHYAAASGRVAFGHGERAAKTITIPTFDDGVRSPTVSFTVELSDVSGGAMLGSTTTAVVRLLDASDPTAPVSEATSPPLVNQKAFDVSYRYDDGNGSGVERVALFVRRPGSTTFERAQVDLAPDLDGRFRVVARVGDGVYRFYTVAVDQAGNRETAPAVADSRTRVDTVAPEIRNPRVVPSLFVVGDVKPALFRMRVTELSQKTFLVKRNGKVVKRIQTGYTRRGLVSVRWFGDDGATRPVPVGRYVVVMKAKDRAGHVAVARVPLRIVR
ncbi:MAG TPA: choice-of-anchor O protein [Nocardioidaceae bacterium]|nr:choice-of-anchor O protein [Nocardioidaceae bacterium]